MNRQKVNQKVIDTVKYWEAIIYSDEKIDDYLLKNDAFCDYFSCCEVCPYYIHNDISCISHGQHFWIVENDKENVEKNVDNYLTAIITATVEARIE